MAIGGFARCLDFILFLSLFSLSELYKLVVGVAVVRLGRSRSGGSEGKKELLAIIDSNR